MARKCKLSGKGGMAGNRVSHSQRKTRHVQDVNLQTTWIYDPETKRRVRLRVSTSMMRTLAKHGGLSAYLRKQRKKTK